MMLKGGVLLSEIIWGIVGGEECFVSKLTILET